MVLKNLFGMKGEEVGEDGLETESETEEGLEGHPSLTPFQMLREKRK